jgi:hypothetical protein
MLKHIIAQIVNEGHCLRRNELIAKVIIHYREDDSLNIKDIDSLDATIDEMITDFDLVEVEYTVPRMRYRVKSLIFPKGTTIELTKPKV